ncbi:alkaline shock response membrane anchor protein AmaP [Corynebacterium mendelii]|uniref:Alkaline shock response membrane anchor protein AmaP n=1 Tax=Corynebacterium mendelii TaxID=2765362 RepID=A0A939E1V5_9CORY|nr:alkaline shock response membrane anchor protein AmaP [Corynebacterium mendelii]MBN9643937.1 alkaline shock response membrane anchor protein AmaP [Corynebacterium mendelii]
MSKSLAAIDRIIVLLVALGLAFLGVWSILFYIGNWYAVELAEYCNQRIWRESPDQPWFKWVLAGIVVVGVVCGLWMILANLRRKRINQIHSEPASTHIGEIKFRISDIGSAVAGQLEDIPRVNSVKSLVAFDRGRPTMDFTINADADANIPMIRSQIDQAERDIRDAIGTTDVDTIYKIHLDQVEHA